ncbi:MAG: tRNA pseudouridine synthase A, partial [Rudaea sp.]
FTIDWTRDLETLRRALNAKLPGDISIGRLVEVPPGFSARYSAKSRVYEYRIYNAGARSALKGRFALWVPVDLNVEGMQRAATLLVGRKDFSAFGTPPRGENAVREVKAAQVWRDGEDVRLRFEANAFLYRMVRRIVGSLLQVGRGELTVEQFEEIIQRKRRSGVSASPQGLTLLEIKYDPAVVP